MHVICGKRSLSKPATNYIEFMIHEGGCVPIPARGGRTLGSFGFHPLKGIGIEYSQIAVILFAIIAPEDVQLFIVKSRCVIFNLGRHLAFAGLPTAATRVVAHEHLFA